MAGNSIVGKQCTALSPISVLRDRFMKPDRSLSLTLFLLTWRVVDQVPGVHREGIAVSLKQIRRKETGETEQDNTTQHSRGGIPS